jgi:hypothetical protein
VHDGRFVHIAFQRSTYFIMNLLSQYLFRFWFCCLCYFRNGTQILQVEGFSSTSSRTGGSRCELSRIRSTTTTTTSTTTTPSTATATTAEQPKQSYQRRHALQHISSSFILIAASSLLDPRRSNAASSTSNSNTAALMTELQQRLPLGHARVRYLLDHWDDITMICGTSVMSDIERKQVIRTEGGGGGNGKANAACNKTPLRVQEFMGYKSINDPLYRIDKLLIRAGSLVQSSDVENYIDAVEQYRNTADATALLAYTSSWGEANPYVHFVDPTHRFFPLLGAPHFISTLSLLFLIF